VFIENMGVAVESEHVALCQHCKRLLRNGVVCEYKGFIAWLRTFEVQLLLNPHVWRIEDGGESVS